MASDTADGKERTNDPRLNVLVPHPSKLVGLLYVNVMDENNHFSHAKRRNSFELLPSRYSHLQLPPP